MTELDAAVYGDRPIASFARWKTEFRRQIKPSLFPIRWRQCGVASRLASELPRLNPGN
jgi:hypothetical protein